MIIESNIDEFRNRLTKENLICFTMDIDWASEYAIDSVLKLFDMYNIPLTIFVTHRSEVLMQKKYKNIELGIHPNFAENSTQGNSIKEVIEYCMNLVPDAKVVRCHRWYSSNDVYDEFVQKGLLYDSNECSLLDTVYPYFHRSGMLRIPTYFEDGAYIMHDGNLVFDEVKEKYFDKPGLKVINVHPMHLMLNTPYFRYTREIKDRLTPEQWNNLSEEDINKIKNNGVGITQFIIDLMKFVNKNKVKVCMLSDIYNAIKIRR